MSLHLCSIVHIGRDMEGLRSLGRWCVASVGYNILDAGFWCLCVVWHNRRACDLVAVVIVIEDVVIPSGLALAEALKGIIVLQAPVTERHGLQSDLTRLS